MRTRHSNIDAMIRRLAAHHGGLITRRTLLEHGVCWSSIDARCRSGLLTPVNRSVLHLGNGQLGPPLGAVAAALCMGVQAFISHRSAAVIHGLPLTWSGAEVSIPAERRSVKMPFVVHRVLPPGPNQMRWFEGVRVSGVARTLVELAALYDRDTLEQQIDDALIRRLTTLDSLTTVLDAMGRQGRHGVDAMERIVVERRAGAGMVRSWLELAFVRMLAAVGMPAPVRNLSVETADGPRLVDLAWPQQRVAIEAMGARWHAAHSAQRADIQRERLLVAAGWRILPATAADAGDPGPLLHALEQALDAGLPNEHRAAS